jgi:TATA-box binding protein (TBP) (component of TFIID and TFIIIB)
METQEFSFEKRNFDDFQTSVKTFIIYLNVNINIEDIFKRKIFPVSPYIVQQKKRGRRKKIQESDPNKDLPDGSVIQVKYKDDMYGTPVKTKVKSSREFFRNATEIYIYINSKLINFKVSSKGKLQMTGCKSIEQARLCVRWFWKYLEPYQDLYTFTTDSTRFRAYYNPVMRNIGFCLDFKINRDLLDEYVNTHTNHISIFESTLGYAGVDIKFELKDEEELYDRFEILYEDIVNDQIIETATIKYDEFAKIMNIRKKKIKYITFLVFQSGKVIMSGKDNIFMIKPYYEFISMIKAAKNIIEETIV